MFSTLLSALTLEVFETFPVAGALLLTCGTTALVIGAVAALFTPATGAAVLVATLVALLAEALALALLAVEALESLLTLLVLDPALVEVLVLVFLETFGLLDGLFELSFWVLTTGFELLTGFGDSLTTWVCFWTGAGAGAAAFWVGFAAWAWVVGFAAGVSTLVGAGAGFSFSSSSSSSSFSFSSTSGFSSLTTSFSSFTSFSTTSTSFDSSSYNFYYILHYFDLI